MARPALTKSVKPEFASSLGAVVIAAVIAFNPGTGHSTLAISPTGGTIDQWDAETGQSIPTGTQGYVGGTLNAATAGSYTFVYGPSGLVAGATGHGNSGFQNVFYVGATLSAAVTAHDVFCSQAIAGICAANTVGDSFTVTLGPGVVPFHFVANDGNGSGGFVLDNGATPPALNAAAFIDSTGPLSTSAPDAAVSTTAFIGLADSTYPGDHDFQDLTVEVISQVPEPGTLAVLGAGLLGLATMRRRQTR